MHLVCDVELVLKSDELVPRGEGLAPFHHVPEGALDGDPEVFKVDGFCDEVKCAAVHRRADVLHISVGGDHDGADFGVNLGYLFQEGEPVHTRHVDVR